MPKFQIPRRSGPHRIAAIALYRALLTQCRAVAVESNQQYELQNIIRNRFKHAQHSHSHRQLTVSFEAGYEAIDHLDAAVAGHEDSKSYLTSLLERAPPKLKLPPEPKAATGKDTRTALPRDTTEDEKQPKASLFDRPVPLEQLSGKRHVPVLFNANLIPILRIKKPQPESLGRYIRQRIAQRQKRHDTRWRLYEEQALASREDEWDRLISRSAGMDIGEAGRDEPKWSAAVKDAIVEVQGRLDDEKEKNRVMAEKMQGVVDREQALYDKEELERKKVEASTDVELRPKSEEATA